MVKKKIDNRIRVMIENGVKLKHRTMFVIVGDKGRDQVNKINKKKQCASVNIKYLIFLNFRFQFYMTC